MLSTCYDAVQYCGFPLNFNIFPRDILSTSLHDIAIQNFYKSHGHYYFINKSTNIWFSFFLSSFLEYSINRIMRNAKRCNATRENSLCQSSLCLISAANIKCEYQATSFLVTRSLIVLHTIHLSKYF